MLALAVAGGLGLASGPAAAAAARPGGGYGPIRLGMAQADVGPALEGIAHDVVFLPTSAEHPLGDVAGERMDRMLVMTPWEDVFVGRIDPTTRIQVGVHGGRVVTVMLRTKLAAEGRACRRAFTALVARNRAEFGPVPVADTPNAPAVFSNGKARFVDWTLYLGRIQESGGTCDLTADYMSDADKGIETTWRAALP